MNVKQLKRGDLLCNDTHPVFFDTKFEFTLFYSFCIHFEKFVDRLKSNKLLILELIFLKFTFIILYVYITQ